MVPLLRFSLRLNLCQHTPCRIYALLSLRNLKTRNNWNSCNTSQVTHSSMQCTKTYKVYIHINTRYVRKIFLFYYSYVSIQMISKTGLWQSLISLKLSLSTILPPSASLPRPLYHSPYEIWYNISFTKYMISQLVLSHLTSSITSKFS